MNFGLKCCPCDLALRVVLLASVVLSACSFPNPGRNGAVAFDRYVSTSGSDSDDGSAARPWRTINHAASLARPGVTIHVARGKYAGSVLSSLSGKPDARISFLADERWAAQIVGDAGSEAAWVNHGDYVDILGFDVSGSSPNGIENLGSFVKMIGNRVHDIPAACDENGGAGMNNANYAAHDNVIAANLVHDVRAASCSSRHGVGIYQSNARGHIYNNIVFGNAAAGIQLWHAATTVIVANNTVARNGISGIVVGAGDDPGDVVNDGTVVLNNIAVENEAFGIQEFGSTGPHNTYKNNLVFSNHKGDLQLLTGKAVGTLSRVPQFADSGYHLAASSPAVNAAIASPDTPPLDFDGGARPVGPAPDLGACERGAQAGKWPSAWLQN